MNMSSINEQEVVFSLSLSGPKREDDRKEELTPSPPSSPILVRIERMQNRNAPDDTRGLNELEWPRSFICHPLPRFFSRSRSLS